MKHNNNQLMIIEIDKVWPFIVTQYQSTNKNGVAKVNIPLKKKSVSQRMQLLGVVQSGQ